MYKKCKPILLCISLKHTNEIWKAVLALLLVNILNLYVDKKPHALSLINN